jgi:hypothetical protein
MERNVGTVDRIVRAVLGIALLRFGLSPLAGGRGRIARSLIGAVGLVLGVTALTGMCGAYRLLGITTHRR